MKLSCNLCRFRLAAALLAIAAISACSMASLGYRHAPLLLEWRITEYFELDGEQRTFLGERLEAVHGWHRRKALPELLHVLDEAQRRLERPLEPADVQWLVEALFDHYRRVAGRIVDESAPLATSLDAAQIAAFEERLAEKALEYQEKWIDAAPERVRRERFERVLENAEGWLGRLSPAQRAWLQARLDEIPADYLGWRAERARRERELVALLKDHAGVGAREVSFQGRGHEALRRWAVDWDEGRSVEERERAERLRQGYIALVVDLVNGATPEQRERVRTRLAGYRDALSGYVLP